MIPLSCNTDVCDITSYIEKECPDDEGTRTRLIDAYGMAYAQLNTHDRPMCSLSGGSDSDVILDMIWRLDPDKRVRYVWFNTGLEYQATKRHLDALEAKYGIAIERLPAVKSVPQCCKEDGQPFLSKAVCDHLGMLQRQGFDWKDAPADVLLERYPKVASAVKWWCNLYSVGQFRIDSFSFLKDFLIEYPPWFKVSAKCCDYAKKKVAVNTYRDGGHDMDITGVRKAEGGVRAFDKLCFTENKVRTIFRPIFWFTDADKEAYNRLFGVTHSDCYSVYGLRRTGCTGCPFNKKIMDELGVIEKHEGGLYRAACSVFKDSYAYTKMYREYVQARREERKERRRRAKQNGRV